MPEGVETPRAPVVVGSSTHVLLALGPSASHVQTGTPLKNSSDGGGWLPDRTGDDAEMIAATAGGPSDLVHAYRSVTLETFKEQFTPGRRVAVLDVDDYGNVSFRHNTRGRWLAVTESQVVMDCGSPAPEPESPRRKKDVDGEGGDQ